MQPLIADLTLRRFGLSDRVIRLWGDPIRAIFAAIALGTIAAFITIDWRILQQTATTRHYSDFGLFYAQAVRGAQGADPYGPIVRPGRQGQDTGKNLNPPHFHLLMRPLTWFPPRTAFAIWIAGWITSVSIALALTYRTLRVRVSIAVVALSVLGTLVSAPTMAALVFGQVSPLLALPMTWAWIEARRARWERAAVALGVLASLKLFLGMFLLYFVVQQRRRAVLAFVAAVVIPWAAGIAAFGFDGVRSYLSMLGGVSWAAHVLNGSVYGVCERIVRGGPFPWVVAAVPFAKGLSITLLWLIVIFPIAGLTLWTVRAGDRPGDVDRAFLLVTTAALLISPLGWSYYCWLFAGPLIALAVTRWRLLPRHARTLLCIAVPGLLCPPPMLSAGQPSAWATVTIGSLNFWSFAAIWGAALLTRDTR